MVQFKNPSDALLWYLKGLLTKPTHTVHHLQGSIIHSAFDRLRAQGKIRVEHFHVLEFYARRGSAPQEDREYKAYLRWTEVADMLKPVLEEKGLIERRQWWQV